MKKLNAILLAAGLGAALPAAAVSWTTTGGVNPGNGNGCEDVACSLSFNSGGNLLTAKAYSTQSDVLDNNRASTASRSEGWIEAQIALYSGGLGIRNLTNDYQEANDPEHAVDNDEVWDVMVFELPVGTWDMTSLSLGYRAGDTGSTDVDIWIGGAGLGAGYDFRGVCFSGCGSNSLGSLGFTQLPSLTFSSNGSQSVGGTATGRYIVVSAGAADTNWEAFKIKGIGADKQPDTPPPPPPPGTSVPEPGSLALLGIGLLGFAWRRRAARG